jgi:3'-phosphoadenosine 5'-phosphosulfate sulfotransferase (PAPS reductase)/FAD synthetase
MKKSTFILGILLGICILASCSIQTEDIAEQENVMENDREIKVFYTNTTEELDSMYNFLENRNGALVIEISNGTVVDTETGEGITDSGYYIHYPENKYNNGDRILSIFIYNPLNNSTDDIIKRIDIKL